MNNQLANYLPVNQNENPGFWNFQNSTDQFAPEINHGDFVVVDKTKKNLEDGKVYLLFHKEKTNEILIRRVSENLATGAFRFSTPSGIDDTMSEEEFLKKYDVFGRITTTYQIAQKQF